MPFEKRGKYYYSPSGRKYTAKQVRLYYATRGFKKNIMAKVSWMWGGKRYSGTLIRETKTHKFARTENGKIKKIKK